MKIIDNILTVQIETLVPNTWNDNEESEMIFSRLKRFIELDGLSRPIIVREYGGKLEIINGFHRWKACKELGWTTIRVNNLGLVSDQDARMLTVLLNRLKGRPNVQKLSDVIQFLHQSPEWDHIVQTLPYTSEQLQNYLKMAQEKLNAKSETQNQELEDKVAEEEVFAFTATDQQAKVIEEALAKFPEDISIGERFYQIADKYEQSNI